MLWMAEGLCRGEGLEVGEKRGRFRLRQMRLDAQVKGDGQGRHAVEHLFTYIISSFYCSPHRIAHAKPAAAIPSHIFPSTLVLMVHTILPTLSNTSQHPLVSRQDLVLITLPSPPTLPHTSTLLLVATL